MLRGSYELNAVGVREILIPNMGYCNPNPFIHLREIILEVGRSKLVILLE